MALAGVDAAGAPRPRVRHLLLEELGEDWDKIRAPSSPFKVHRNPGGVPHAQAGLPSRRVDREAHVLGGYTQDDAS